MVLTVQIVALISFPSGDNAAQHRGIDLRYFYQDPDGAAHPKLVGAVRFGNQAAVGAGFFSGAHGGAIEAVRLDFFARA